MAIVAAAAAASSGVGIGTASLRRQPTEVAFTVAVTLALVGIALCLLAFVLTLLLQQRPGLSGTGARRPRRRHYLVTLGAIAVFVAIAELLAHTAHRREPHLAGAGARAPTRLGHHHGSLLHLVPSASYATIGVVVLVLVVVFVLPLVHRLFMAPRHFEALGRPEPLSYPVGERDLAGLTSALEKSEIADPHTEPDPRRAVVKAWLSMTEAAKAAGTPRRPS
ncbi:MAG: hypothetical protein ACRDZ5_09875, partial [Acidimicrobiales bacterium]